MTMNHSRRLDETETPAQGYGEGFDHLKKLIHQQVEDAEANLDYARRQYERAQKELQTAKASYARICADDPDELTQRRRSQ